MIQFSNIWRNAGWLLMEYGIRFVLNFAVGIWLARYLGPENWGWLMTAVTLFLYASQIVTLGHQKVLIRRINEGTGAVTQLLMSSNLAMIISYFAIVSVYLISLGFYTPEESILQELLLPLVLGLSGITLIVFRYYFEAKVDTKKSVWLQSIIYIIAALAKLYGLLSAKPLLFFAWILGMEHLLAGISYWLLFITETKFKNLTFKARPKISWQLTKESFPLLLIAFLGSLANRFDQLALSYFHGAEYTGWYSVAYAWIAMWFVVSFSIIDSFLPRFIKSNEPGLILTLNRFLTGVNLLIALGAILIFPLCIHIFYGEAYSKSANLIYILALAIPLSAWFNIRNALWISIGEENRLWKNMLIGTLIGLSTQIVSIYFYKETGAAIGLVFLFLCLSVNWLPINNGVTGWLWQAGALRKPWLNRSEVKILFNEGYE